MGNNQVKLHVARGEKDMLAAHDTFHPDAIVAPFLTKRVPERLWRNNTTCPVLIVHPGVRGDRGVSSIDWALKGMITAHTESPTVKRHLTVEAVSQKRLLYMFRPERCTK